MKVCSLPVAHIGASTAKGFHHLRDTRIPSRLATSLAGGLVIRTSTNNGGKPWSKSGCRTAHTRNEESTTRNSAKAKGRATRLVPHLSTEIQNERTGKLRQPITPQPAPRSHHLLPPHAFAYRPTAAVPAASACVASSSGSCSFTAATTDRTDSVFAPENDVTRPAPPPSLSNRSVTNAFTILIPFAVICCLRSLNCTFASGRHIQRQGTVRTAPRLRRKPLQRCPPPTHPR